jgi:hypothetical protein
MRAIRSILFEKPEGEITLRIYTLCIERRIMFKLILKNRM